MQAAKPPLRAEEVQRVLGLLAPLVMIPSPVEASPLTGVITFVDAEGFDRSLDFIGAPRGLEAGDVRETAVRVNLTASPADPDEAVIWIMHPERCMESRIYNAVELKVDSAPADGRLACGVRNPSYRRIRHTGSDQQRPLRSDEPRTESTGYPSRA